MTWPPPCSRSPGSAALVTLTTPKRLVSTWARKSSGSMSSTAARFAYPALLTTTSMRPKRSRPAGMAGAGVAELRGRAGGGDERVAGVEDGLGDRTTEAAARAGEEEDRGGG